MTTDRADAGLPVIKWTYQDARQVLLIFTHLLIAADCPDPNCSEHGFCVEGSCVCRQGWRGPTCNTVDHEARQCLPDCAGHGDFDLETQKCICKGQWTGNDCSKGKKFIFFFSVSNTKVPGFNTEASR